MTAEDLEITKKSGQNQKKNVLTRSHEKDG